MCPETPQTENHVPSAKRRKLRLPQFRRPQLDFAKAVRVMMTVRTWLLSQDPNEVHAQIDEGAESKMENGLVQQISSASLLNTNDAAAELSLNWKEKCGRKLLAWYNFYVDPTKNFFYWWSTLVSVACAYNLIIIIARVSFTDFDKFWRIWIAVDYTSDVIYLVDMLISARKGFLENGQMVIDKYELWKHYKKTTQLKFDVISIFPTDILYLIWPGQTAFRLNRIVRCYRLSDFIDRTETRTSFPNAFRVFKLLMMIFVNFHWNACLFFALSKASGIEVRGTSAWQFQYDKIRQYAEPTCDAQTNPDTCLYVEPEQDVQYWNLTRMEQMELQHDYWMNKTDHVTFSNLTRQYIFSLYWSALILTTIGEQVVPTHKWQFVFVTIDILLGLLIFATIVGNVGEMVTNMNAAKAEFEEQQDGVKQYMEHRKVNHKLQTRIIKWFGYIWGQGQSLDEEAVTAHLPSKLKTELAMRVHLETLKRVKLFQDCEPGLLVELVLKLKLQVFSPGDYICRKGDVGKEMYIVKRGSLNVVAPDGIKVFVTLKEGSVFGELSIMDIPGAKNGNKRSAGVRSVGYSDLFVLSKDDLWEALREYPEAKKILLQKGREILAKDNLIDESVPQIVTGPLKTVTQKVDHLGTQIELLEENLNKLYAQFANDTAQAKQRITALEHVFYANKQQIKQDIMSGEFERKKEALKKNEEHEVMEEVDT